MAIFTQYPAPTLPLGGAEKLMIAQVQGTQTVTATDTVEDVRANCTSPLGFGNGPTWTFGAGAPSSTQPVGSLYSRTDGAVGSTLYVSAGGGTWNAVAGV